MKTYGVWYKEKGGEFGEGFWDNKKVYTRGENILDVLTRFNSEKPGTTVTSVTEEHDVEII
jgi:hypothetical protein